MILTKTQIQEIKERHEAFKIEFEGGFVRSEWQDVGDLLETVEALMEENEKLKLELHTKMWGNE